MNRLIKRPHIVFWISILFVLVYGLTDKYGPFDSNVHDTPFIMHQMKFAELIGILFGLIGIVYWIMDKARMKLTKWLNLVHIALTLGGFLLFWVIPIVRYEFNSELSFAPLGNRERFDAVLISPLLLMIIAQLFFWRNIVTGLKRKKQVPRVIYDY